MLFQRILHEQENIQYLYDSTKSKSHDNYFTPRPTVPKQRANVDESSLKINPTPMENGVINMEGTGGATARMRINKDPDEPLNREFTLDLIKSSTGRPNPTGHDLINRNTLIRQEYNERTTGHVT